MYETKNDLPESVKVYLPDKLQDIYLEAYQEAWEEYEEYQGGEASREAVAHRDAMHAVKRDYTYYEEKGTWYKKGEEPEETEDEDKGIVETVKDMF
jgi:cation transport regulator